MYLLSDLELSAFHFANRPKTLIRLGPLRLDWQRKEIFARRIRGGACKYVDHRNYFLNVKKSFTQTSRQRAPNIASSLNERL